MMHRKSRVNPVRFLGIERLTILRETEGPLQRGIVSALLGIASTHFSAPLLRNVAAEVVHQLRERGNLLAGRPLSVVDFYAHCEDPGIVFLSANTQRGLQDTRDFFDGP